jgi:glycosyltransferase involved in cell wall biosynthesis
MKKVLIVAELFYASPRIPGLAKYLPEFGWQPILLTTPLGEDPESNFGPSNDFKKNNEVVETFGYTSKQAARRNSRTRKLASKKYISSFKPAMRFLYRRYSELADYPDFEKGWIPFAVKKGEEVLQHDEIQAIISSSPPPSCQIIASKLKTQFNIPWIADFRDPWTQSFNYSYSRLRKFFERRLEVKTMSTVDSIVTPASLATQKMGRLHKGKSLYTITNGFDPETVNNGTSLTKKFTITYTGQIYPKKRDPLKLFIAIKDLVDDGSIDRDDIEVRFYGQENDLVTKNISKFGLSGIVTQFGIVPRLESTMRQRESQVLLLLNWEDPNVKEVYTGKIFEYLAALRPILSTGGFGNDVVEALLKETNSGIYCQTVETVKEGLRAMYRQYKEEGKVRYCGDVSEINKYSYREMAREFAEILSAR